MQKNFLRCANHVREKCGERFKGNKYNGNLIFFGECMVKHTMSYDWEKIPPFLGFDIYDTKIGKYLSYELVEKIYEDLDLNIVPLIKICKVKDVGEINDKLVPISEYSKDQSEGICFKNYDKQLFSKYVREKFKEENKKVFGLTKKRATNDEEYLTAVYGTNARIDKWIFKLVDDGNKLDMTLMHKLPNAVYTDIWEENFKEIYNMKNKTINFGEFKKKVSLRCLAVLQQTIINNNLNEGV